MKKKFKDNLGVIYLEEKRFEEQVKLFNNAKLIVMAHGAAMSNLFFCKKGTIVIEADCGDYKFFSTITKILGITHIRIQNKHNIITQKIIRVSPAELYNVMPEQPALPVKCIRDTCNFFKNSDPQNNKEGFCCRLCKIGDANHGKWCNKTLINSVPISKD